MPVSPSLVESRTSIQSPRAFTWTGKISRSRTMILAAPRCAAADKTEAGTEDESQAAAAGRVENHSRRFIAPEYNRSRQHMERGTRQSCTGNPGGCLERSRCALSLDKIRAHGGPG